MARRTIMVILVILLTTAIVAGCVGEKKAPAPAPEAEKPAEAPKEKPPISIGYLGPLTGDGAPWGKAELNTLEMLVEDMNQKGGLLGRKIKLSSYDNRMDQVETTNAARKLIEQDKVVAIIGTNSSSASIALAGVAEQYKIPHVATTATNPAVTVKESKARPFSFRVCFIDPQQGAIMAKFAFDELKAKKVAVLYEVGSDYSVGLSEFFQKSFKALGGEIVAVEAYKTGDVDFRAQLTKIKAAKPDAIWLPALYKEIGLAANQARQLGIKSTLLGGDSWFNLDLFTVAKAAVEGSYLVQPVAMDDPGLNDFKARYKAKYGSEPGAEGANAFFANDAFSVLIDSIKRAGADDPLKIRDELEKTKALPGITGTLTISKDDHNPVDKEGVILKMEAGKYVFVKRTKP